MDYASWSALVRSMRGVATAWPFEDDAHGEPAARFTIADYTAAFNAGKLPTGEGTRPSNSGLHIYVLATAMTGDNVVLATAPHTMTFAERAANAAFTAGDSAADAAGLPSLAGVEDFLKDTGKNILVALVVTVAVSTLLKRR